MGRNLIVFALLACCAGVGVEACSGVALVQSGSVIVGGNEDNNLTGPEMWATPASPSAYGVVYFGLWFDGLANRASGWYEMQGLNDQGLYFDLFSVPCTPGVERSTAYDWRGPGYPAPEAIECTMMATCATVDEALVFLRSRDYATILPCVQVFLVDRSGVAAVYTGIGDVFRTGSGFVVTNFNLANPSLGEYPDARYSLATRMLGFDHTPTLDRAAQLLRAMRMQPATPDAPGTRYTVIGDLTNEILDVYVDADFTSRARLELAPLWAEGHTHVALSELDFVPSGLP
jgi:hypothetical protein